jgi:hypothetical protein
MSVENKTINPKDSLQKLAWAAGILFVLVVLAFGLAWAASGFTILLGWDSFFWVLLISSALLYGGWRLLGDEKPPRWLFYILVGAALLRLAMGTLWFAALPIWGHGTPAENAGYVMGDAARRDIVAWKLGHSNNPLSAAFENNRSVDQYGGLLFLSAIIYRYFGSLYHQPLLMVAVAAACSALAVLFTWAFARRVWGEKVAAISAWAMFLYPEAVLLGSSQMREAFTIPMVAAAFYGLARYRDERSESKRFKSGLVWMLVALLITTFFSTLAGVLLLGALMLAALVLLKPLSPKALHSRWFWISVVLLVMIGMGVLWLALREVTPPKLTNPIAMLSWWLRKSAAFQSFLSEHASGWTQKIFKLTPEWTHLPMLLIYGVVQPFLPAALVVGSEAPIWHWITIWRSLGWTLLLGFLAFAPFHSLRKNGGQALAGVMTIIIWLVILVAAFRGGSDMWDNPRYRAIFACLEIALAAQILVEEDRTRDPWLKRALLMALAILVWFFPWYLQRYYSIGWSITDPFRILGLGIVCGVLLVIADWARPERV